MTWMRDSRLFSAAVQMIPQMAVTHDDHEYRVALTRTCTPRGCAPKDESSAAVSKLICVSEELDLVLWVVPKA